MLADDLPSTATPIPSPTPSTSHSGSSSPAWFHAWVTNSI